MLSKLPRPQLDSPQGLEHSRIALSHDIQHPGRAMRHFGLDGRMLRIGRELGPITRGYEGLMIPVYLLEDEVYLCWMKVRHA